MKAVLVNLDENDHLWLKRYCDKNRRFGLTVSFLLRQMIADFKTRKEGEEYYERSRKRVR